MRLRIGTRNSELARAQAGSVAARLEAAGHSAELVPVTTAGDRSRAPVFSDIGSQGVFVRDISRALVAGTIDLAVHSYKDVPTDNPDGLVIAAVPPRLDAADCLLVRAERLDRSHGFLPLPAGARVGTSSVRRQAWLRHFRPDLRPLPLRGNVPTRIRRLQEGHYDAVVLAAAGLHRLRAHPPSGAAFELAGLVVERLDPGQFVPAPAQGALAVQCRRRRDLCDLLAELDHPDARRAIDAERLLLARLEGGCELAFGAYCRTGPGPSVMYAMLEQNHEVAVTRETGPDPQRVAASLWQRLRVPGPRPPPPAGRVHDRARA